MAGAEEEMNSCRLQWGGRVGVGGQVWGDHVGHLKFRVLAFIWEATEEFQK